MLGKQPRMNSTTYKQPKSSNLPFHGYSCSLYNDHLYLFGGISYHPERTLHELQIYSLIDNTWIQPSFQCSRETKGRIDHSACVYKNMIFFVGGRDNPDDEKSLRTTDVLALDLEKPANVTWVQYGSIRSSGPRDCIKGLSHIHDDKMFIYTPDNWTLSYFDFINDEWKLDQVQGKSGYYEDRVMIFCDNKLFGFHQDPECKESRNLLMLDLDSLDCQYITLPDEKNPHIIPSNINCSMNGMIYIFATDHSTQNNELWSFETDDYTWVKIEDSGSLVMIPEERHTMLYKSQILSISADLQNRPSIEIQYATLSEELLRAGQSHKEICKENPEQFITDAKSLYEKMLFTDVIFEVEGQEIPAHKFILAYRSQYFMALFTSGGQESKLYIPDIKADLFKGILQYLYCNEIELNEQLALELLPILDNYLLENLRSICEKYLARQIRKENVINLLITADKYKIQNLKEACFKFIVKNLEKVTDSDEVMELSKPLFLELPKFQNQPRARSRDDYDRQRKEEKEEVKKNTGPRKRGRPRKCDLKAEKEEKPEKGIGRPGEVDQKEEEEDEKEEEEEKLTKGRGRPRKAF